MQENIDLIKLQREVKEKSTKLSAVTEKYAILEEVCTLHCIHKGMNHLKSVYNVIFYSNDVNFRTFMQ